MASKKIARIAGQSAIFRPPVNRSELTTAYNPDNTRATGSLTEGASANIFGTVSTNTVDAAAAVTEWSLFSASSAGTLFDRQVFSVINFANGDSFQTTYTDRDRNVRAPDRRSGPL